MSGRSSHYGAEVESSRSSCADKSTSTSVLDSRIFISYRHADSAAYAGRLYDRLQARYGDEQVFRDLEMDYGIDFVERIEDTVSSCVVMVVVIGPGWLNARDDAGHRRLDDADDYVRIEISSALRRSLRVIPVLVGEAKMPAKNDLPDALRALARRNALPISDSRWDYDVSRLIETVNRALQEAKVAAPPRPPDELPTSVVTQPTPAPTPEPPATREPPRQPVPSAETPRPFATPQTPGPERGSVPRRDITRDMRRRRAWIAAAAAAVGVAVAIIAFASGHDGSSDDGRQPELLAPIPLGSFIDGVAVTRSVWVARHDGMVTRIDPVRRRPTRQIPVGIGKLDSVAVRGGSVWVTGENRGMVARIDEASGAVEPPIAIGGQLKGLALAGGSVWVANCRDGTVTRIGPEPGSPPRTFRLGGQPRSVATGGGRVYVAVRPRYPDCPQDPADRGPGQVAVLAPHAQSFQTLLKVDDPTDVALTKDSLWVADRGRHRVLRVDPETGDLRGEPVVVAAGLEAIADGQGAVWALSRGTPSNGRVGTVTRIDPETMKTVGSPLEVEGDPQEIAVGAGRVWVTQGRGRGVRPIRP